MPGFEMHIVLNGSGITTVDPSGMFPPVLGLPNTASKVMSVAVPMTTLTAVAKSTQLKSKIRSRVGCRSHLVRVLREIDLVVAASRVLRLHFAVLDYAVEERAFSVRQEVPHGIISLDDERGMIALVMIVPAVRGTRASWIVGSFGMGVLRCNDSAASKQGPLFSEGGVPVPVPELKTRTGRGLKPNDPETMPTSAPNTAMLRRKFNIKKRSFLFPVRRGQGCSLHVLCPIASSGTAGSMWLEAKDGACVRALIFDRRSCKMVPCWLHRRSRVPATPCRKAAAQNTSVDGQNPVASSSLKRVNDRERLRLCPPR